MQIARRNEGSPQTFPNACGSETKIGDNVTGDSGICITRHIARKCWAANNQASLEDVPESMVQLAVILIMYIFIIIRWRRDFLLFGVCTIRDLLLTASCFCCVSN